MSVVQLINKAIGAGWTFTLLSGICLLVVPMPLAVLKWGPRWRKRRRERVKAREEKKAQRQQQATDVLTNEKEK